MAVRFYHILAQRGSVWNYLGKSSDLVFKVEPDKSIDCDDGQTLVGSEKLSCSFSLLSDLVEPYAISKLMLVPAVSGPSSADPIEINVGTEDYQIEQKSGEFGKTLVNIGIRYPSDVPAPWRYRSKYFASSAIIMGRYTLTGSYISPSLNVRQNDKVVASTVLGDEIVPGLYCIIGVISGLDSDICLNDNPLPIVSLRGPQGIVWQDMDIS